MLLADGRRVLPAGSVPRDGALVAAPGFRCVVLANRPGHPFLGNDFFRECGDVLSCHVVDNPDLPSELALLEAYAPDVHPGLRRRVAALFRELRAMSDEGILCAGLAASTFRPALQPLLSTGCSSVLGAARAHRAYPYSTREAVSLVKHLQLFPHDGLLAAAENVFAFGTCLPSTGSNLPRKSPAFS